MECFRLQFLSGMRDLMKAGSLRGIKRGVGGVRKSIDQSWLAKGLGLLCWGFKGVQDEIPSEEANTLQIGSVAFPPGKCPSPQLRPCHRLFDQDGYQDSSSPSIKDYWLLDSSSLLVSGIWRDKKCTHRHTQREREREREREKYSKMLKESVPTRMQKLPHTLCSLFNFHLLTLSISFSVRIRWLFQQRGKTTLQLGMTLSHLMVRLHSWNAFFISCSHWWEHLMRKIY